MSRQEALFQSLATSGAVLMTFVGVCHFVVGAKLFPWAPDLLGPIVWYGLGIVAITMGFLLLLGTLRIIRFPVFSMALLGAAVGLVVGLFTAAAYQEFHLFAFTVVLAATGTAVFHRKASRLAALTEG